MTATVIEPHSASNAKEGNRIKGISHWTLAIEMIASVYERVRENLTRNLWCRSNTLENVDMFRGRSMNKAHHAYLGLSPQIRQSQINLARD
jgi:hypothetical protein